MGVIKPGIKARLESIVDLAKLTYHISFIPVIIYLGFRKGPEPGGPTFGLLSLLWQ